MSIDQNERALEAGIHTDLSGRMTYAGYLRLDRLLSAQQPLSDPPHHDEMLFIIQHQTSELWLKLLIHELSAALAHLRADRIWQFGKVAARCKRVLDQLTAQWSVLETLTPSEYMEFRDILGPSSGFQSLQYRMVEFLMGNKNAAMVKVFAHEPEAAERLRAVLEAPGLYDEFLRYLARWGHAVPPAHLERDWSQEYAASEAVEAAWGEVYRDPEKHWDLYELGEELTDLETAFRVWRFRHVTTVERIIGFKPGTGGTSGVSYLRKQLDIILFPELWAMRTGL